MIYFKLLKPIRIAPIRCHPLYPAASRALEEETVKKVSNIGSEHGQRK